jgi:hypothetical protein
MRSSIDTAARLAVQNAQAKKAILVIFGTIFLLVGGFLTPFGLKQVERAEAALKWPTTKGVVVDSYVRTAPGSKSTTVVHYPAVQYRYEVEGRRYTGTRIRTAETGSGDPTEAEETIDYYRAGREVEVSYNPALPSDAMLEPGVSNVERVVLWVGVAFLVVGLTMKITGWRLILRKPKPPEPWETNGSAYDREGRP